MTHQKTHTGKKFVSNNFRFSFQVTNLWRMDSMMVAHKIFHIQYCALSNSVWIISFFSLRCSLWSSTKWHTTIHCGCRRRCCYFFSELMIFFLSCLCLHCTPLQSHWLSFSLSLFHARYTSQHRAITDVTTNVIMYTKYTPIALTATLRSRFYRCSCYGEREPQHEFTLDITIHWQFV